MNHGTMMTASDGKQSACKSCLRLRKERQSMEQQLSQYKQQLHKAQALLSFRTLVQVLGWSLHMRAYSWADVFFTHVLAGDSAALWTRNANASWMQHFSMTFCFFSKMVWHRPGVWILIIYKSYGRREPSSAWVKTWCSSKVEERTPEHGWAAITFQATALPCSGHAAFSLIENPVGHREVCYSCHVVDALEGMRSSKLHSAWLDL